MSNQYFYLSAIGFLIGVGVSTVLAVDMLTIIWVMTLALVALLFYRRFHNQEYGTFWFGLAIFLILAVLGLHRGYFVTAEYAQSKLHQFADQVVTLDGVVVREPEHKTNSTQIYLETDGGIILLSLDRFSAVSYGDRLKVKGELKSPEEFETDLGRTFNYPAYLKARGVLYLMRYPDISVLSTGEGNPVLSNLLSAKHKFSQSIKSTLGEPEASLGLGLLLGINESLGEDLEQAFRRAGVIHIVVLSGYNVMIVVTVLMALLAYFMRAKARLVFGLLAITAFALIVGLSATVVRACLMAALLIVSEVLGLRYLVLRALFLAGAVMVAFNPYLLLYDVGFQLSFIATLGLILISPIFERRLTRVPEFLSMRTFLTATLATQLAVLPLLLYQIGEISLVAVMANVLILPMVPVAMLLTFATGLLALFVPSVAMLVGAMAEVSLGYIIRLAQFFASWPLATVKAPAFGVQVLILLYVLLAIWWWRYKKESEAVVGESSLQMADWLIEEESTINNSHTKAGGSSKEPPADNTPIFFR